MVVATRIDHAQHALRLRQPLGQQRRRRRLPLHPQRQGFQALEQDPRIEGRQRRPGMAEIVEQRVVDPFARSQDDAAQAPALTVDMLGRAVHHHVRAQFQRVLVERRGEHVVDHEGRAVSLRDRRDAPDVDQLQRGIGGRFAEEEHGVGPHRGLPRVEVLAVHQRHLHAHARHLVLHHPAAGAEQGARRDHVVALLHAAKQRRRDGPHARREAQGRFRPFQGAHALLEGRHGGVGVAGINEALVLAAKARLRLFGGGVNEALREKQRLRRFPVRRTLVARMDEAGGGFPVLRHAFPVGEGASRPSKGETAL